MAPQNPILYNEWRQFICADKPVIIVDNIRQDHWALNRTIGFISSDNEVWKYNSNFLTVKVRINPLIEYDY